MRIVLGVGGGIAAYKSASLLRLMTEAGHEVTVVPTVHAEEFVGRATWEALSGHPVSTDTFDDVDQVRHVRLGREAELVVVAPATADLLARTAVGMAPDLLGNVLLTATCPVLVAPAMHTEMWLHPATQENVAVLRRRGVTVLEPAVGRLTGKDSGPGRLPEPEDIWAAAQALAADAPAFSRGRAVTQEGATTAPASAISVATSDPTVPDAPGSLGIPGDRPSSGPLSGRRVVITGGGTREPLDPVRYLGNRSSGKQAVAIAEQALAAGADVTLIAAAMTAQPPAGAEVVDVESTQELLEAVLEHAPGADALVMAAAVADFRPVDVAETKIKKGEDGSSPTLVLERTPDVLATAVAERAAGADMPGLIVGFAAETGDGESSVLEYAQAKLARKGCEMLVVNDVGAGRVFGRDETEVTVLFADGREPVSRAGDKTDAARLVVEQMTLAL
ncbi:bifunctional phosphopantothenoylcysteine decarboxylase/phosphopantothenate synthase [Micrococcus lylae]|uniref:Coenzyme A biosynthesis bifunctional protein CoaBC n=1 Tax=Micrococcus lylae TaxID=1273 RepID=A0ABY2K426_9MICC|nr:bifunctional phosphopantothenoylcysteine decarboxylase/phosphopantothenate synthase [Micrococcus lylae]TFH99789.1 bifunctional phosphopantothenoylcysteine decarboxylase/phosphopantothenate synthase [Micrococcus lylae]